MTDQFSPAYLADWTAMRKEGDAQHFEMTQPRLKLLGWIYPVPEL